MKVLKINKGDNFVIKNNGDKQIQITNSENGKSDEVLTLSPSETFTGFALKDMEFVAHEIKPGQVQYFSY